jgi:hypothetical protein
MATGEIKIKVREEGSHVNAYIEVPGDQEQLHVASVRKALLEAHPQLFDLFHDFAVEIVKAIIGSIGGEVRSVTTEAAPEHERAGHG